MSISAVQNSISSLTKEIADLNKSDAQQAKKEADLIGKSNRAAESARRASSSTSISSKLREIERVSKDLAGVREKRADIAKKVADKTKRLHGYQQQLSRQEEQARKKVMAEQKRLQQERETYERRLSNDLSNRRFAAPDLAVPEELYDFFISHASEDKEDIARALAEALQGHGARVWYDEFTLKVGDGLRRVIDRGLRNSKYGVVILSEYFFKKEWTNRELDGLVTLEDQGQTRILPIWHKVSKDEVARYSPTLADKLALNTSIKSVEEIAQELMGLLKN